MSNQALRAVPRPLYSRSITTFVLSTLLFACAPFGFSQSADTATTASIESIAVPRLIKYSGILLDQRGYPITIPADVTFSLYEQKSPAGKPALWKETQHVSPNEKGAYTVYLGVASESGLPTEVFTTVTAQWLGIQAEGEAELQRVLLASVPYALKAGDAQTLGGLPASAFALAASTTLTTARTSLQTEAAPNATSAVTTTGGVSGYVPKFIGASSIADSQMFVNSSGVGINTSTPAAVLDVNGDMIVRGPTIVSRTGNATSAQGFPSYGFDFYSNAYNSSTKVADNPHFILQSEPVGNNTSTTSATFNVLYSNHGKTAESGFYINSNGTLHFAPAQTFPNTLTNVGLVASSDFDVFNSPITTSGDIGLFWKISPTNMNSANAIVKRDSNGSFSAGVITGTALAATGSLTVYNTSYMAAANLAGPIGIGTNSPAALMNLNKNNAANADTLLLGNTSSKGLQFRDNGSGVDIESIGTTLNVNYVTQQPTYLNANGGAVVIADNRAGIGSVSGAALVVGAQYSAEFEGDVQTDSDVYIEGDLSVGGSKDFRIDHPMDPANKYLVHAAIESSEVLNQYSGNVTTDELGLATIHLPDWFEVENTDFRYQLTVIGGQFAQAIVSKKVAKNQFTIGTNAPHVEVSWQVTAKRNDPYMKVHPFVVEQEKPASKRGHYDHPELYGHPEESRAGSVKPGSAKPIAER